VSDFQKALTETQRRASTSKPKAETNTNFKQDDAFASPLAPHEQKPTFAPIIGRLIIPPSGKSKYTRVVPQYDFYLIPKTGPPRCAMYMDAVRLCVDKLLIHPTQGEDFGFVKGYRPSFLVGMYLS